MLYHAEFEPLTGVCNGIAMQRHAEFQTLTGSAMQCHAEFQNLVRAVTWIPLQLLSVIMSPAHGLHDKKLHYIPSFISLKI